MKALFRHFLSRYKRRTLQGCLLFLKIFVSGIFPFLLHQSNGKYSTISRVFFWWYWHYSHNHYYWRWGVQISPNVLGLFSIFAISIRHTFISAAFLHFPLQYSKTLSVGKNICILFSNLKSWIWTFRKFFSIELLQWFITKLKSRVYTWNFQETLNKNNSYTIEFGFAIFAPYSLNRDFSTF